MDLSLKINVADSADVAAENVAGRSSCPSIRTYLTKDELARPTDMLSDRNRNILLVGDADSLSVPFKTVQPVSPNPQDALDLTTSS
jgi:hypothetical protein